MTFVEYGPDQFLDMPPDAAGCRVNQGAAGSLDGVGQKNDPGLPGLRFGTGIAEVVLPNTFSLVPGLTQGFLIKKGNQARAVVLLNEV